MLPDVEMTRLIGGRRHYVTVMSGDRARLQVARDEGRCVRADCYYGVVD